MVPCGQAKRMSTKEELEKRLKDVLRKIGWVNGHGDLHKVQRDAANLLEEIEAGGLK